MPAVLVRKPIRVRTEAATPSFFALKTKLGPITFCVNVSPIPWFQYCNEINELRMDLPINISDTAAISLMRAAAGINWTRDPFDRLIVAESIIYNAKLMTKDSNILSHFNNAVWF